MVPFLSFLRNSPSGSYEFLLFLLLFASLRFTAFCLWADRTDSLISKYKVGGLRLPQEVEMYLIIALLLLVMWAGGFMMFHVAGSLIHLLLLLAVISFVVHLVTGAKAA